MLELSILGIIFPNHFCSSFYDNISKPIFALPFTIDGLSTSWHRFKGREYQICGVLALGHELYNINYNICSYN
jgi:hypothetical protein